MADEACLDLIFRNARTHNAWLDKPIGDDTLRQLYDTMKWGPTSANANPARFVFLRTKQAKERLRPCLAPGNVETPMIRNDFLYRKVRPDLENPTFEDAKAFIGMLHVQPDPVLQPEEVSAAIMYLCSEEARHVTGAVLDISAGATARANA